MVSTRRNLNNQTASAKPEIVNSGRIAKKRRSNGPQKRLSTHIKNIIVDKCLRKESMKKAGVARMFGVSWQTVDRRKEGGADDGIFLCSDSTAGYDSNNDEQIIDFDLEEDTTEALQNDKHDDDIVTVKDWEEFVVKRVARRKRKLA
ncbi:hypothetical protein HMPREF1544_03823 [Mucor circinelloides 1006PhL]|uniref:Uncharacterized protein n=1 Tax=Mucor circinelloides f. circinelloides (strain 1006PhL) TaxID=1220926 RepID=S2JHE4_MUCC1|nr:hypothetical protein HMPREF1544_03823 [Mucor circinelloides 1006PhL]